MEQPNPAPPIFKKRNPKNKSTLRKRATPPPADSASSSSSSDDASSSSETERRTKRRKKNPGAITATSTGTAPHRDLTTSTIYTATRTGIQPATDATKSREWYDEHDAPIPTASSLLGSTRPPPGPTYKPLPAPAPLINKNPAAPQPPRQIGPLKAASNVRTITVTDFAPDVCKDYKQTGFCGFGDNCKFLHAREDYKQGWQLDREWEDVTKGGKKVSGTKIASAARRGRAGEDATKDEEEEDDDEDGLEALPWACVLCKGPYREAVVTRCGHYFCEKCALGRYRRDPSCVACGAGTGGVFNVARRLRGLLERKRERARRARARAVAAGEEVGEEEEEGGEGGC